MLYAHGFQQLGPTIPSTWFTNRVLVWIQTIVGWLCIFLQGCTLYISHTLGMRGLRLVISSLCFYPFLIIVFLFVIQDGIIKNYFRFIFMDLEKHYVFPYFKYGKSLLNLCMHFFLIDVIFIMLLKNLCHYILNVPNMENSAKWLANTLGTCANHFL